MRDSHAELVRQAAQFGTVDGVEGLDELARDEVAMLADLLPFGTPDDIYLVTSLPILREVGRKLIDTFGYEPREALRVRFSLATLTPVPVLDFDPDSIDRLTRDRGDDMIVHTAFEGRAEFIVTADQRHLLVSGEGTEYTTLDGRSTRAYSLPGFANMLETSTFSLEEVPDVLSVRVGDRPPPPGDDQGHSREPAR